MNAGYHGAAVFTDRTRDATITDIRKRAPRKTRATAPKRGRRVARGMTHVFRPAWAESALEREVREMKRLLTTRKPKKAQKKRAPSRRKR